MVFGAVDLLGTSLDALRMNGTFRLGDEGRFAKVTLFFKGMKADP